MLVFSSVSCGPAKWAWGFGEGSTVWSSNTAAPWVKHWSPKRSIEPGGGGGGISRGYILLMSCFSSTLSPAPMFLICCVFKYIWHVINMCSSSTKPRKETQKEQKHLKVWNENSPHLVWMNVVDLMWINHPCMCFNWFIPSNV